MELQYGDDPSRALTDQEWRKYEALENHTAEIGAHQYEADSFFRALDVAMAWCPRPGPPSPA